MLDSGFQSPGFRIPEAKNSWKVIISGNIISSISYHYHHTDPADNVFYFLTMEDTYSNEQKS